MSYFDAKLTGLVESLFHLFQPIVSESEVEAQLSYRVLKTLFERVCTAEQCELTLEALLSLKPRDDEEAYHLELLQREPLFRALAGLDGEGESLSLRDLELAYAKHQFSYVIQNVPIKVDVED